MPQLPVTDVWESPAIFTFLNTKKQIILHNFDWSPEDVSRLWRYNLHYFDYLREQSRSDDEKQQLLESWIANNPQGSQPGWEPFTASLRIVNWIFYLQGYPGAQTPVIMHSLYLQVRWLEKNDERHILANHYFENLKALTFAGAFFSGKDAKRWLDKGTEGLIKQVREQTLSDGGHYERTPQYHGLMLENYLDVYNLARNNPEIFGEEFVVLFADHCLAGLAFYQSIIFPDNKLPLFNDTAFGVSPGLVDLDEYWQKLSGQSSVLEDKSEPIIALTDTGLYAYRSNTDMFIIDAGDIGPAYQPGHTHCDMLSYELMLEGQRVIVDSGVSEYEPGEMRQYVRSTRGHNTVSVGGAEQSEVWGEFRVARRAKVLEGSIFQQGNKVLFRGAYNGFHELGKHIVHKREVKLELSSAGNIDTMIVTDEITGKGVHTLESFIHLHPDALVTELDQSSLQIDFVGAQACVIRFAEGANYALEESYYCPEFGVRVPNICVILRKKASLPARLSYALRKL